MKKNTPIEPSLLSIFRLFLCIQLGLTVLNTLAHMHLDKLVGCPTCTLLVLATGILLLIGYLSWPRLANLLGRAYLPIALTFSIFLSLVIQSELIHSFADPRQYNSDENAWQTFLYLFFPVILVAWQYNFKEVIRYSFISSGLEALILHFTNYAWFHQYTYQRSILIRTVVFLAAGYVIALIMKRQREERQSLIEANRKLRHYSATLEQLAVTQERNRMSRELHDTLAHTLSGLTIQLEAAHAHWRSAPERSLTMLEKSLQTAREGLTESRKAIQALRASPLEDLGLLLALRNLVENAAGRCGATLSLELPDNMEKLAPEVEQCIYRVGQEALENIVHHAGAHHIHVQMVCDTNRLTVKIQDDGQGFDQCDVDERQHLGLKGLRERVTLLAGNLQIESHKNQGTTIHLIIERSP